MIEALCANNFANVTFTPERYFYKRVPLCSFPHFKGKGSDMKNFSSLLVFFTLTLATKTALSERIDNLGTNNDKVSEQSRDGKGE